MLNIAARLNKTLRFINSKVDFKPEIGIILGTGLGALVDKIKIACAISYSNIPYFPRSTAPGHKGEFILGRIYGKKVCVMEGRFHYYEGYSMEDVTYPVRVMRALGANVLVISNAAGGLNPKFKRGDIMLIADHINLMGTSPLIGPNDETLGPRFPDMYEVYDKNLISLAGSVAAKENIKLVKGVYAALTGPNLETPAEYKFLRAIGADAVGMSTVPEVIVAVHAGFRILGLSVITDLCFPQALKPVNIEEIIEVANRAEPELTRLVTGIIHGL